MRLCSRTAAPRSGKRNTLQYQRFIDRWFENPPPNAGRRADADPNIDPYQHVDMD